MLDLWWINWHWERVFSNYFGVPLSLSFRRRFIYHRRCIYSSTDSVTQYHIYLKKNQTVPGFRTNTIFSISKCYNYVSFKRHLAANNITYFGKTICTYVKFNSIVHNNSYMYMFRTRGFIFRRTVATSTGRVQYMSKCIVHPGSSKCLFAEITIKCVIRYTSIIFLNLSITVEIYKTQIFNFIT